MNRPKTQTEKLNTKNKRAVAKMKADSKASVQRHQDVKDGKLTAAEALQEMAGQSVKRKVRPSDICVKCRCHFKLPKGDRCYWCLNGINEHAEAQKIMNRAAAKREKFNTKKSKTTKQLKTRKVQPKGEGKLG